MRHAPGVELMRGESADEASAATGRGQALGEHTYGDGGLGLLRRHEVHRPAAATPPNRTDAGTATPVLVHPLDWAGHRA